MLVCEATIFAMSMLLVTFNMSQSVEGYGDIQVYTVMCSMSTIAALSITLMLICVPNKVCPIDGLNFAHSCTRFHGGFGLVPLSCVCRCGCHWTSMAFLQR